MIRRRVAIVSIWFFLFVWGVSLWGLPCEAGTLLVGKRAKEWIGELKEHLLRASYSALTLDRKNRDPIHLEPIDAVIFNTGEGKFKKKRTRDRNQVVVLDTRAGQPGERVTKETLPKYLSLVETNHMIPFVFQGEGGEELAVIYTDPYNICYAYETPRGIRIHVKTSPFRIYRSLEENPIRIRKLLK